MFTPATRHELQPSATSAFTGYHPWYFLARQGVFVAAGLGAASVAYQIPLRAWRVLAPYLFLIGAALLVAVLIPGLGRAINGSKRWLSLGLVNLQPSEFMKLAVVLYAASYAVRRAAFLHADPDGLVFDIVTRTIGHPWLWLQEVTSTLFIYGIFIGASVATKIFPGCMSA